MRSVGCGVVGTAVAGGVAAALGSARFERGRLGLAVGSAVSVTLALLLSGGRPVYGGLRRTRRTSRPGDGSGEADTRGRDPQRDGEFTGHFGDVQDRKSTRLNS